MFYAKINNNLGLIGYISSASRKRLADEIAQINGGDDGRRAVRCSNMAGPNNPLPEGDPVQNLDDLEALNELGLERAKNGWGGSRGGGRPPFDPKKRTTQITVTLPPDAMAALERITGGGSRSAAIARAILEMDARENPKT